MVGATDDDHRPGDRRLRDPAGHGRRRATSSARRSASTSPPRSARPPAQARSSFPRPAQDPLAARSCAGCCATSPRAATWATPPRSPTPAWSRPSGDRCRPTKARGTERGAPSWVARPRGARGRSMDLAARLTGRLPDRAGARLVDMDGVRRDALPSPALHRVPFRDWDAFFQACGDDELIAEVARLLDVLDPDLHGSCCSPHGPHAGQRPDAGVARPLRAALGPARHARLGDYGSSPGLQAAHRGGAARTTASTCGSPSRTTAATSTCSDAEGVPLRLHPLRLLR